MHSVCTYVSDFINTLFQNCAHDLISILQRSNTVFVGVTLSDKMFCSYNTGKKKKLSQQYFAAWYTDSNDNQLETIPQIWGLLSQRKWDMRQHEIILTLVERKYRKTVQVTADFSSVSDWKTLHCSHSKHSKSFSSVWYLNRLWLTAFSHFIILTLTLPVECTVLYITHTENVTIKYSIWSFCLENTYLQL